MSEAGVTRTEPFEPDADRYEAWFREGRRVLRPDGRVPVGFVDRGARVSRADAGFEGCEFVQTLF